MPNPDQIDIKQAKSTHGDKWLIEFDYNEDFVAYIKMKVPSTYRDFDRDLLQWTVWDPRNEFMPALESVAVQKFRYAIKTYYNPEGKLVIKNLKTGVATVQ